MADDAVDRGGLSQASLSVLGRYGGKRGQQLLAAVAAAQVVAPAAKWALARYRRREDFTITVAGTDDIYPDLHDWVLAHIPEGDRKAMIGDTASPRTRRAFDDTALPVRGKERPQLPFLRLRYDGTRTQTVTIEGHSVRVEVSRDNVPGGREHLPSNWRVLLETIKFTASTVEGRDAIVHMIDGLIETKYTTPGPPALMVPSRWGGDWNRRGDLPQRDLNSVILKAGQLERLMSDLAGFLGAEREYNRFCQPWHRGYLFHGSPGTGKTSVARALADHFGLTAYYLPLGDLDKDADLMALVGAIEPRSMLLIEDVDVYHAAKERSDEKDRTSVAAMLNALDGVFTPHGLITVLTTNNRDALDDALVRAGRVDVDEEFTVLDADQVERMMAWWGGESEMRRHISRPWRANAVESFVGQSPAAMIEQLRQGGAHAQGDRGRIEAVGHGDGGLLDSENGASAGARIEGGLAGA